MMRKILLDLLGAASALACAALLLVVGCSEPAKPTGASAGSSPSLDSKNADERAAAAREAAKKYGTGS